MVRKSKFAKGIKRGQEKSRKAVKKLKMEFKTFQKIPTIGEKVGDFRRSVAKKVKSPKLKKARGISAARGRQIAMDLSTPPDFDIF